MWTTVIEAPVRRAAVLARELEGRGFVEGFPPALSEADRHTDAGAVRRARCPACRGRLVPRPYHRPGRGYKIVAECPVCGAGEEF